MCVPFWRNARLDQEGHSTELQWDAEKQEGPTFFFFFFVYPLGQLLWVSNFAHSQGSPAFYQDSTPWKTERRFSSSSLSLMLLCTQPESLCSKQWIGIAFEVTCGLVYRSVDSDILKFMRWILSHRQSWKRMVTFFPAEPRSIFSPPTVLWMYQMEPCRCCMTGAEKFAHLLHSFTFRLAAQQITGKGTRLPKSFIQVFQAQTQEGIPPRRGVESILYNAYLYCYSALMERPCPWRFQKIWMLT